MGKLFTRVGVIAAIIGFIGVVVLAISNYLAGTGPVEMVISATETAEAKTALARLTEIAHYTNTPTLTPTATSTLIVEPQPSSGYTIYDTFDIDMGVLKFTDNSTQCHNKLENGAWKFECFGSATENVNLTLFPAHSDAVAPQGVEMAFYTLPILDGKSDWGKYQLLMRFGSQCSNTPRGYVISIRPNELTFIEVDSKSNSINPPSPKMTIGTLQPHVIKLELQNGKVNFYLDGNFIRDAVPLENTIPVCWLFQSQDNGKKVADGYRGIVLQWVAIKP